MKLKRFNEYAGSNTQKVIPFNSNEKKYFSAKSKKYNMLNNVGINNNQYFVNCIRVQKLESNEYYLPSQDITCTTIQSAMKYTEEIYTKIIKWLNPIFAKIENIDTNTDTVTNWYYEGKIFAIYNKADGRLRIKQEIFDTLEYEYMLSINEARFIILSLVKTYTTNIFLQFTKIVPWN